MPLMMGMMPCRFDLDIVLTDVRMPAMDGIELLAKVLAVNAEIPVILITGYTDFDQVVAALKNGAFDFIHKPYEVGYLLKALDKAIAYRTMRITEFNYKKDLELAITKRTNELEIANSAMLKSEKMALLGQLAAGVAHEINNPISCIMSNLQSLQKYSGRLLEYIKELETALDGNSPAKTSEQLAMVKDSLKIEYISGDIPEIMQELLSVAELIKGIVKNLKNFSRADESECVVTDINRELDNAVAIVKNEIKYVATVVKEYGEIPPIACHPNQITQVFMNLLVNASHAIEGEGKITVRTSHDDQYVYVAISDTGCGMSETTMEKIFEPFFTTKEAGKGTGLGLSICSDIVRKHNGDISVESTQGIGTTFTVKLPISMDMN